MSELHRTIIVNDKINKTKKKKKIAHHFICDLVKNIMFYKFEYTFILVRNSLSKIIFHSEYYHYINSLNEQKMQISPIQKHNLFRFTTHNNKTNGTLEIQCYKTVVMNPFPYFFSFMNIIEVPR